MICFDSENGLSRDCFESILQTISEGIFIVDKAGIIRYCNRGLEEMAAMKAASIVGRRCSDLMACACDSMRECGLFTSWEISNVECQLRRADGVLIPVLKNGRVLKDGEGNPVGGVETLVDISAIKQSEQKVAVLEEQMARDRGGIGSLIGRSEQMKQVFELVTLAAASNASVLITGETGTGKELAARSIHRQSARKDGPLVTVNCSALPESLLESELFGHAKGAFTGAIKDKVGRFERAEGGTLFLDEIGELSPFIQVKLLRFLQEREFERVGESVTRKADVRIIAATNRDLRAMIKNGEFREDLFYRLKVFPVHLPPLRERKEDIGPLVNHFIERFNKETGKSISSLTHDAALTMMDYCWPGNIRELENAIEHAFVTCREADIGIFDLPIDIRHVELRSTSCVPSGALQSRNSDSTLAVRDRVMTKGSVESALRDARGNRTAAARMLGVDRTTLWRNMKRFGVT